MKNKPNQQSIQTPNGRATYTTLHVGGVWTWSANRPDGQTKSRLTANRTTAEKAAKTFLGVTDVQA